MTATTPPREQGARYVQSTPSHRDLERYDRACKRGRKPGRDLAHYAEYFGATTAARMDPHSARSRQAKIEGTVQ